MTDGDIRARYEKLAEFLNEGGFIADGDVIYNRDDDTPFYLKRDIFASAPDAWKVLRDE